MDITIQGLSVKQRVFADILWALNGQAEVQRFINSLPLGDRVEAEVVMNMMVAAVFDQIDDSDFSEAQSVIRNLK